MNDTKTWGEAITLSLMDVGQQFVNFFPTIIGAILILILGWIISVIAGKLISKIISRSGLDSIIDKLIFKKRLSGAGMHLAPSVFIGALFKWFLALVFLMAATSVLGLEQVTIFINEIVIYLPNVIVAVIILTFVFLLGNFIYHVVKSSTHATGAVLSVVLASISRWSIIVFGIFAALIQLEIASSLIYAMFIGLVGMISLAGGLAFGLGGKEEAQLLLRKFREELTEKHK